MDLKTLYLLVTRQLLTSYFLISLSREMSATYNASDVTNATMPPTNTTMSHIVTNISQTTSNAMHLIATSAPRIMTTIKPAGARTISPPSLNTITGPANGTKGTFIEPTFDAGSFMGGMVLAMSVTLVLLLVYKFSSSRREVRYHTIEEHDAII